MSFHDKGIGYYIPPELKDFGKGAYDLFKEIRPFNPENIPTYDFNKPFKQNILDIIPMQDMIARLVQFLSNNKNKQVRQDSARQQTNMLVPGTR